MDYTDTTTTSRNILSEDDDNFPDLCVAIKETRNALDM